MLASGFGAFSAMVYTWWTEGKPNPGMMVNGMLAGLVAITAPSGFVGPVAGSIIGLVAGVLVCLAAVFIEKVLKVDDPVGAVAVHGVNGLWGVLATGLFADGTSNYGGTSVTGLFYGNVGQFVAQVIGGVVCFAWAFGASYIFFKILNRFIKLRVSRRPSSRASTFPRWAWSATSRRICRPATSSPRSACSSRPCPADLANRSVSREPPGPSRGAHVVVSE